MAKNSSADSYSPLRLSFFFLLFTKRRKKNISPYSRNLCSLVFFGLELTSIDLTFENLQSCPLTAIFPDILLLFSNSSSNFQSRLYDKFPIHVIEITHIRR